jgi:hypothetical protein
MGHPREHRGQHLGKDNVLRNDRYVVAIGDSTHGETPHEGHTR